MAEDMEIWKNKKSGKGFIYIEDTGEDEALLVTPEGEIKGTEKAEEKTRSVTRDYVCECKRREVEPFSEDFWRFIKDLDEL